MYFKNIIESIYDGISQTISDNYFDDLLNGIHREIYDIEDEDKYEELYSASSFRMIEHILNPKVLNENYNYENLIIDTIKSVYLCKEHPDCENCNCENLENCASYLATIERMKSVIDKYK